MSASVERCRIVGFSRSAMWRPLQGRDDASLRSELKALAEKYPKYGCPTLHDMLRTDGHVENHKRTYRIYCEEGLQVRTKRRKKLFRPRVPMVVPECAERALVCGFRVRSVGQRPPLSRVQRR
jgi:putative transposase